MEIYLKEHHFHSCNAGFIKSIRANDSEADISLTLPASSVVNAFKNKYEIFQNCTEENSLQWLKDNGYLTITKPNESTN